jgi:hypothetical protein
MRMRVRTWVCGTAQVRERTGTHQRRLASRLGCGSAHNGAKHWGNPARPTARWHQAVLVTKKGGALARTRGVCAGTAQPSPCTGARGYAVAAW